MPIPTYEAFIGPLLQVLAEKSEEMQPADVYDEIADRVGLDEDERREQTPSTSRLVYRNRIGWAQDAAKRNGLSSAPRYGWWLITEAGRDLLHQHGGAIPDEVAHDIATRHRTTPLAELLDPDAEFSAEAPSEVAEDEDHGVLSPEDKIDSGLQEIRASVAREVLELVLRSTPTFFEQVVLDVLHAMGYGANRSALQRVGGSGDGGIDGVISLDRLGLEKVYVQAKRYTENDETKNRVGSPAIRDFVGALQLHGANKGVLITSGRFSQPAIDSASRANIVLIDGDELAKLMIENEVGVSVRSIKIPRVDSDYFEE